MRLESIELQWFRGAADSAVLNINSKSLVVYGENGSGKSSFVDALEYILNSGKIGHLAHEYSGKNQEKGVVNTHVPADRSTILKVKFSDSSEITTSIARNGTFTTVNPKSIVIDKWDYRRTILRQDEVASFIGSTKGVKYSQLLPLLGLSQLEMAAENVRQLTKSVEQQSKLKELRAKLKEISLKTVSVFGGAEGLAKKITEVRQSYAPSIDADQDMLVQCRILENTLKERIAAATTEQKKHVSLCLVAEVKLPVAIAKLRDANDKLLWAAEPLVAEKLQILKAARSYSRKTEGTSEIVCPACGQKISAGQFKEHLEAEQARLQNLSESFEAHQSALETLCDTIKSLKSAIGRTEIASWKATLEDTEHALGCSHLEQISLEKLRVACTESELKDIETMLVPIVELAFEVTKNAPPEAKAVAEAQCTIETAKLVLGAAPLSEELKRAESLISFLQTLETNIRDKIRVRSQEVINEISSSIQRMWAILHPGETIQDVRLYIPEDTDKAIDIELKFHGIEQDSPRLTLSEGYRNSLGLCIFLALAKTESEHDRPLILDDVVVSLDRNHRGMILDLLESEFKDRQVVVFTHDREWYTELRQLLDPKRWNFKVLLPYKGKPSDGIRVSEKTSTFADARAHLDTAPDAAGNTARKIMDIELSTRAEKCKVRLPYLHGFRNDHRGAHDFLQRLISEGDKCFQTKTDDQYVSHTSAIDSFKDADRHLLAWGNRASHTFDIVHVEAEKLIDVCEKAVDSMICDSCRKSVHHFDDGSGSLQCSCGQLRWRYDKIS